MASLEDRNLAVDGHRDYSSPIPSRCTADSTLSTDIRMLSSISHWIRHLQGVAGPGAMPDIDGLPPAVLAGGGPDGVLWPAALAGADADQPSVALGDDAHNAAGLISDEFPHCSLQPERDIAVHHREPQPRDTRATRADAP
jgi:hypothetical protein